MKFWLDYSFERVFVGGENSHPKEWEFLHLSIYFKAVFPNLLKFREHLPIICHKIFQILRNVVTFNLEFNFLFKVNLMNAWVVLRDLEIYHLLFQSIM